MYDSESDGITKDEYMKAIKNGDLDTVKAYVLSNGTIDLLLDIAIIYNQAEITEYLLQHDAPLDIFNGIKWSDFIVKFIKKRVKVEALSIAYIYRCLRNLTIKSDHFIPLNISRGASCWSKYSVICT